MSYPYCSLSLFFKNDVSPCRHNMLLLCLPYLFFFSMGKATIHIKNRQIPSPPDHAIRSRLLNSLGIYKAVPMRNPEPRKKYGNLRNVPAAVSHQRSSESVPFRLPLNDSAEIYTLTMSRMEDPPPLRFASARTLCAGTPPSPGSSIGSGRRRCHPTPLHDRSIHYQEEVLVVPIASRHDYSDRIRKALWSGADELSELVERNRAEFSSEGWDVNYVVEEDDMYIDAYNGELVHPVWLEQEEEIDEPMVLDEDMKSEEPLPTLTRSTSFATNLHRLSH